tara:strand:+ start:2371 stop:3483 length:1113 start_codon:yes stop_codon:yes gene_type:complete
MLTKKDLKKEVVYKQLNDCGFIFRCKIDGASDVTACVDNTFYTATGYIGGHNEYRLATQKEIDLLNKAEAEGTTSEEDWYTLYNEKGKAKDFSLKYSEDITEHFFNAIIQYIKDNGQLWIYDGWPKNSFADFKEQGYVWDSLGGGRVDNSPQYEVRSIEEVKEIIGYTKFKIGDEVEIIKPVEWRNYAHGVPKVLITNGICTPDSCSPQKVVAYHNNIAIVNYVNTHNSPMQLGFEENNLRLVESIKETPIVEVGDYVQWKMGSDREYEVVSVSQEKFGVLLNSGGTRLYPLARITIDKVVIVIKKGNQPQPENEVKQTNKQDGKVCKVQHKNFKITTGSRKRGKSISGGGCSGSITSGSKGYKARVVKG